MRRGSWAESPSVLYQMSINGVITRKQLLHAGVADGTIRRRCRDGGAWTRLLPGVVLLSNGYPSPLQRMTAAQTYGGPSSLITGRSALERFGYADGHTSGDVHILIPEDTRHASVSFVRSERTWRLPDAVNRGTLRLAPLARNLVDFGRSCTREDLCAQMLSEAIRRGGVGVEELAIELVEGPTRHSALTRKVLGDLGDNAHSIAEIQAQKLYARSGLPPMVFNCVIVTSTGDFLMRADGWIEGIGFAWEIDSLAHHLTPRDHQLTMERRARAQNHGIIVVSHLPSAIRDNPERVIADLQANYRHALARPRPNVRME